ncbi:MAG: hypothetical protein IKL32_05175, partial [Alphaproteobacteria bacterium]|nr:hypothetical protein [Alphaproteobacteria bacterium]
TSFSKFNRGELISIYKSLQSGMKASTSTVSGTKKSIEKKRKTLEKWFDEHELAMAYINVQDINDIFKTARETGFLNTYGSDTVMKMANSGKNVATVQDRIRRIDDVSDKLKKGQIANSKVLKSMQLNDRDFQAWLDEQEMSDYTRALRRTNANAVKTDEQREFDKLSSKTKRNANALTKEENEIATISKRLNKNLKKKK